MSARLLHALVARPIAVSLALATVVALGVLALSRMPVAAMPHLARTLIRIEGSVPGVGMEELEAGLVRRLEERLLVLPDSDALTTWCRDGVVAAEVAFRWGREAEPARLAAVEALDGLATSVPVTWEVTAARPAERADVMILIDGEQALTSRSALAEDVLVPALTAIPGVGAVELHGGHRQRIVVRPDPHRLNALGVTPGRLRETLARAAQRRRLGTVEVDGEQLEVATEDRTASAAEVADLALPVTGDAVVRIGDVASVELAPWPDHGSLHIAGAPAVAVAVSLEPGANALAVSRRLDEVLAELGERLPEGLVLSRRLDGLARLRAALVSLFGAAVVGALVAGALLFLFVRQPAALLLLVLVIPLSLCAALTAFEALGLGLNLVSLVGMALAAGMLVDAAVVVLEAGLRRRGHGPERAVAGTTSVARAIVASAVTTAVVFVPALTLHHLAAALFRQLALALMVTLLASLVFALLAVPVAVARLAPAAGRGEGLTTRLYRRWLTRLSHRPWWAPVAVAAALLLAVGLARDLPQRLLAPDATDAVEVRFALPLHPPASEQVPDLLAAAAPLRRTGEADWLAVGLEPGHGPPLPAGYWHLPGARTRTDLELLGATLVGAGSGLVVTSAGPAGSVIDALPLRRLAVDVRGDDRARVEAASRALALDLRRAGLPVVADIPAPAVTLEAEATDLGRALGPAVERITSAALAAVDEAHAGHLRLDERALAAARPDAIQVVLEDGSRWPLDALAELTPVERQSVLVRHHGQPSVRLLVGAATADVAAVEEMVAARAGELPAGVAVRAAGGILDWREARAELAQAMVFGLALVFLVLAAMYDSFRVPLLALSVLPFALIGAFAAQRLAGEGIDLGSGLGCVLLAGLAVNNAVLLLDRLRSGPAAGAAAWSRRAAGRFRPVLVTTLTTLATLGPIALAGDAAGAAFRESLARTAFAGLLVSTPAALFVLPPLARLALRPHRGRPAAPAAEGGAGS